jgi:hypothetical protein
VLDGFENDVPGFVRELKKEYPPEAAGLLAKLMPPDTADDPEAGRVISVTITPIKSGTWVPARARAAAGSARPPELRIVGGVDAIDTPIANNEPGAADPRADREERVVTPSNARSVHRNQLCQVLPVCVAYKSARNPRAASQGRRSARPGSPCGPTLTDLPTLSNKALTSSVPVRSIERA